MSDLIALFPIPNLVAFPGTRVPLHVFEPRYRRLVHESVDAGRPVGVCHTLKTIRPAPQLDTPEKALSTNQATYAPQAVFSAGPCRLVRELSDGRLLAEVDMNTRYQIADEHQTLPYLIVKGRLLEDRPDPGQDQENLRLQDLISRRLIAVIEQRAEHGLAAELSGRWADLSPAQFSFEVFSTLQFDPDAMQDILAATRPSDRLQAIWEIVNQLELA